MSILKRSLLYLVAGFCAQLVIFFVAVALMSSDVAIAWLWNLLLPGIYLFWREGIHSSNPLLGLPIAIAFNTVVYAVVVLAFHSLSKRIRKKDVKG
jgi:hypothetical protein